MVWDSKFVYVRFHWSKRFLSSLDCSNTCQSQVLCAPLYTVPPRVFSRYRNPLSDRGGHSQMIFLRNLSCSHKVWPLAQFFLSPFLKRSLICLEGKSMTPSWGNTILFRSSRQLPRLRLGPSKGFLSWHGALLRPSTRLVHCFRNYRDTRTLSSVPR